MTILYISSNMYPGVLSHLTARYVVHYFKCGKLHQLPNPLNVCSGERTSTNSYRILVMVKKYTFF